MVHQKFVYPRDNLIYEDLKSRVDRFLNNDKKTAVEYLQLQYLSNFLYGHHLITYAHFDEVLTLLHRPYSSHQLIPLGHEGSIF